MFGYRLSYLLPRPWKIAELVWDRIKWAWQRVFRGWDDTVIWSIDYYLCEKMPEWLETLKNNKIGIPIEAFSEDAWNDEEFEWREGEWEKAEENWHNILDEMISGFEAGKRIIEYDMNDGDQETFEQGMDLFKEHFFSLWD